MDIRDLTNYKSLTQQSNSSSDDTQGQVVESGTCGKNVKWLFDKNDILTITGTGEMDDYKWGGSKPWERYKNKIKRVVIKEGVTGIGSFAFYTYRFTDITLPDSLIKIGDAAFRECRLLQDICIPHGVEKINNQTFEGCSNLERVSIPDNLKSIGSIAFIRCKSLRQITLGEKISIIDKEAFDGCSSLCSIVLILRSLKTAYDPFIYWLNRVKIVQMAFGSVNRLLQTSGSLLMNEQTSSLI